ncbi:hypothetical protein [Kribbella monticola]|nr:hypothetical protein [Kribbella monticola]
MDEEAPDAGVVRPGDGRVLLKPLVQLPLVEVGVRAIMAGSVGQLEAAE